MQLAELIKILHDFVPGFDGTDYLTCEKEITRIGVCIDPTRKNIENALKKNVQLLITYHPYYDDAAELLENNSIIFLPLHEALDIAPNGINQCFAKALNLKDAIVDGKFSVGNLDNQDFRLLIENCQRILDLNILSYYGDLKATVKKVAIFSGSGFLPQNRAIWQQCLSKGCDTIISGETTIVALRFAAANGLKLIDIGHNGISGFGLEHFTAALKAKLAETDCSAELFRDSYALSFHTKNYFLQQNDETEESLPLFFFSERFDVE